MVLPISLLDFLLALIIIQQPIFFFSLIYLFFLFLSPQSSVFEVEALFPLRQASGKLPFKCSHRPLQTVPTDFQGGFPFSSFSAERCRIVCALFVVASVAPQYFRSFIDSLMAFRHWIPFPRLYIRMPNSLHLFGETIPT